MEKVKKIARGLISLGLPFSAAAIGSYFTTPAVKGWYQDINKLSFSPPDWLFAPVWTILFLLMGIAFYIVWSNRKKDKERRVAITLFIIQLILNAFWSILFFGIPNFAAAFVEIVILWIFIILTMIAFKRVSKRAYYLLIPYLLWVSFAMVLNLGLWLINPNL